MHCICFYKADSSYAIQPLQCYNQRKPTYYTKNSTSNIKFQEFSRSFPGLQNSKSFPGFPGEWEPWYNNSNRQILSLSIIRKWRYYTIDCLTDFSPIVSLMYRTVLMSGSSTEVVWFPSRPTAVTSGVNKSNHRNYCNALHPQTDVTEPST